MFDLLRDEPFIAFRFDLRFDLVQLGGFSECTGLSLDMPVQDYAEGGRNGEMLKFPTRANQSNVVLKRGIVSRLVWEWYASMLRGQSRFRRNASIMMYDVDGRKPTMILELANAFPCKWTGPELNAAQSNIALESLEICHEGLTWIN